MSKKICLKCGSEFEGAPYDKNICFECLSSKNGESKMNNKLMDLNNLMFAQLERLNSGSLNDEQLKKEIERSKAMTSVAQTIINNANMVINAQVAIRKHGINPNTAKMIDSEKAE